MSLDDKKTILGSIPEAWEGVKLADVFKLKSGDGLSKSNMIEGNYPVYGGNGITFYHGNYNFEESKLIIGRVGAKCGCIHRTEKYAWITDNALIIDKSLREHDTVFLEYILYKIDLNQYANKNAQPVISGGKIYPLVIPFPPLPEQQKIADILSTVDAKIEIIDQQITETQELKKGLMQRLLTKGIGHTEFKDSALGEIPKSWGVVKIGDLLEFKNGLNKGKDFFGKGIPIVNYMDVFRNQALTLEMLNGKVDVDENEIRRFNVKKGDVFFTRTSETIKEIGYSACFVGDIKDAVFSGFVLRARPINEKLDLHFKKYCFDSYLTRKEIISKSTMTTRALTNGTVLSNVQILLPPKKEQQKIASILSSVDEKKEILEEKKNHYQELKQGLMQQLLTGKVRVKV